uniref:Uncharacterized protein n=1 Tax=Anguilla anguilla TaxID=7936 RepID=A0A0E9VWQ4_ANGAN
MTFTSPSFLQNSLCWLARAQ